jgi:DNA topoisomerase-1
MDYEFTAGMEDKLDDVANGDLERKKMLTDFYTGFEIQLDEAK